MTEQRTNHQGVPERPVAAGSAAARHHMSRTRTLIAVAAAAGIIACTHSPEPGPAASDGYAQARTQSRAFVDSMRRSQSIPGFAATVMVRDTMVWSEGFGLADRQQQIPATPATKFRVGSISKLFTSAALMRLVDAGLMDPDAPLRRHIEPYPAHWPDMTARQLAGHTAGVRHYRGAEYFMRTEYQSLRDAMSIFSADTLLFTPGTRYAYTSYGYNLLGAAMEKLTGESFPVLMRRLVLDPLDMSGTLPDSAGIAIPGRATLYDVGNDGVTVAQQDNLSSRWPSGGYLSTTSDMARFASALLQPGFLSRASLDMMFTPQRLTSGGATQVGMGWRIGSDAKGRRFVHHGGSSNGGSAFLLVYPDDQLVVSLAANALGSWSLAEALTIAAFFLPES